MTVFMSSFERALTIDLLNDEIESGVHSGRASFRSLRECLKR